MNEPSIQSSTSDTPWMEIDIEFDDEVVKITARGSQNQHPDSHTLDPAFTRERLDTFARAIGKAATYHKPLSDALINEARTLYAAVFQGAVRDLATALRATSTDGRVLHRIMICDHFLQAFPWEALCEPSAGVAFWGNSQKTLLARGVNSSDPWKPREIRGATRFLLIAPFSSESELEDLRHSIVDAVDANQIQWLKPLVGEQASKRDLFDNLRRSEKPNIIHFVGHGDVNVEGHPMLRLADNRDGDETNEVWIEAEALAHELTASFSNDLRLIVLEACEGAKPGALGSAAEIFAKAGADAVVAHLWPIRADVARACSRDFYRSLLGATRQHGDVVDSLGAARRTILLDSAEGFSPVLYLRGPGTVLFTSGNPVLLDFRKHEPGPAGVSAVQAVTLGTLKRPWVLHQPPSDWVPRAGQKSWRYKVVAFDFDGTLLRGEQFDFSWELVWHKLNVASSFQQKLCRDYRLRAEKAADEERVEAYREWCESAVNRFRLGQLTRDQLKEMAKALSLTAHCREALSTLREEGVTTALISGGIQTMLEDLFPDYREYFDFVFINELTFDARGLIAGVHVTSFDFEGKADALRLVCDRAGCSAEETVFVGDQFNDDSVMIHAHLAIAYPPHNKLVRAAAKVAIDQDDLRLILPYVLVE